MLSKHPRGHRGIKHKEKKKNSCMCNTTMAQSSTSAGWSFHSRCCCPPRCPPASAVCRYFRPSWILWAAFLQSAWAVCLWADGGEWRKTSHHPNHISINSSWHSWVPTRTTVPSAGIVGRKDAHLIDETCVYRQSKRTTQRDSANVAA